MKRITTIVAALAAAALVPACGTGNSSGDAAPPAAEDVAQVQRADAASDAADQAVQLTSEAVVDTGTQGQVAARGQARATTATTSTVAFNYQANVDLVLDLDSQDDNGQDRWPNATGQVRIVAAGTLSGTATAGSATYAVETEWLTDGVFTDPISGCTATILQGSGIDYSLSVEWTYTAEDNWMITAEADASGQRSFVVVHEGQTWTIDGQFSRHWDAVFTRAPGHFSINVNAQGHREVTVSNGTETHTVVIDVAGLDAITIVVDGVVYGPYTAHQIRQHFGCSVE